MASQIDLSNPLNVTVADADGWWIHLSCACGRSASLPLRLLAQQQPQLADTRLGAVVRQLRCKNCDSKQLANAVLTDDPARSAYPGHPSLQYSAPQSTSISLMAFGSGEMDEDRF